MAQQQHQQQHTTASSVDAQLTAMINELYNTEMDMQQTGTFVVPTTQSNSPRQLFGTRNTAMSLSASTVSSPSLSSNRNRTAAAAVPHQDDDYEHSIVMRPTVHEKYRYRTLGSHNINRMAILPIFPYTNVKIEAVATLQSLSGKAVYLLLCNVPLNLLSSEQYARLRYGTFPPSFHLEMSSDVAANANDSFLLGFYQDLYGKLKKRLKVDISILDFNLTRLRQCIDQVVVQYQLEQTMLNMNELASALEFYLQIDVDMFFLKTCSFNGVKPRLFEQGYYEGLFCLETPQARFTITPCQKPSCLCCHSPCPRRDTTAPPAIQFSLPHIHRFVNQYEAILNCPATCESKNCIYVLTCPCKQFDFIGESKVSFAETLAIHREEGNRIIREFLIGQRNIEYTTQGLKSDKKKANDKLWLYQHSARCSVALKLFLDENPEYWCFVPMKSVERQLLHDSTVRGYLARQTLSYHEASSSSISNSDFSTTWTRTDADVRLLLENLPQPPFGYMFNHYQRQQQANFFKWTQDRNVPLYNVDLYNANIVAILPDHVSKLFRKLIESLFITHAECKLNQTGHLLLSAATAAAGGSHQPSSNVNPNRLLENIWCVNLTHRPTMST